MSLPERPVLLSYHVRQEPLQLVAERQVKKHRRNRQCVVLNQATHVRTPLEGGAHGASMVLKVNDKRRRRSR